MVVKLKFLIGFFIGLFFALTIKDTLLSELKPCDDWKCVNSFAPWLSAIGTIIVSGLAYRLSLRDRRVLMESTFDTVDYFGGSSGGKDIRGFSVNYTNVGSRDIYVTGVYFKFPYKKKFFHYNGKPKGEISKYSNDLPEKIEDGQSGNVLFDEEFSENICDNKPLLFRKSKLKTWYLISMFEVYVKVSIGKPIKVKVSKNARKKLWLNYLNYRKYKVK